MKLSHLYVTNYRALRELDFPLGRFACLTGRNNAGKSTVLQAISLFFTGTKLGRADYFDHSKPIRIAITFTDVTEHDLLRLAEEHRQRIESIVDNGKLTLVRHYDTDGKSRFKYSGLVPKDKRFQPEEISKLLTGKKKAADIVGAVESRFPELKGKLADVTTQAKAKDAIQAYADTLPAADKHLSDADLITGIDASIKAMLPECIYIPAVKNLADDTKTSQATPFGKILGILMDAVEPKLGDIDRLFKDLQGKFNRMTEADGTIVDNRLNEVKVIESTLETFVKESFANISLEIRIPPPELRTLLSSAEIMIDDGVYGSIDTKGDGLRRAVVFAVLRSYVALAQPGAIGGAVVNTSDRHLLLFEEPEIYLHPAAQQTLFSALQVFAERNHVVITTHSPLFFGPQGTDNFVRLAKKKDTAIAHRPFSVATRIDLDDLNEKDRFHFVCYENNNAAFFFDCVILVEGPSDFIAFPHIANLLSDKWKAAKLSLCFARVGGKASIRKYRQFFRKFGIRVIVLTDLDILVSEFEQLEPSADAQKARSDLLQIVDKLIPQETQESEPAGKHIKAAQGSGELRGLWARARELHESHAKGQATFEELNGAIETFFNWERKQVRLEILKNSTDAALVTAKRSLLSSLRDDGVCVLEKGALEAYYPKEMTKADKPTMAQELCRLLKCKDDVLKLCDEQTVNGVVKKELEIICDCLIDGALA